MFEPFQKFLSRAASSYGVKKEITAIEICSRFSSIVPGLFEGKETAEKNIHPAYYKNSTLFVRAASPGWAQEIAMRKEKIIAEMNEKSGKKIINDLKILIGKHG